jgi:hypothetical protein
MGGLAGPNSGSSGDAERVPWRRSILRKKSAAKLGAKRWWASSDEDEYEGLEAVWVRWWGVGSWRLARELKRWKGLEGGEEG